MPAHHRGHADVNGPSMHYVVHGAGAPNEAGVEVTS